MQPKGVRTQNNEACTTLKPSVSSPATGSSFPFLANQWNKQSTNSSGNPIWLVGKQHRSLTLPLFMSNQCWKSVKHVAAGLGNTRKVIPEVMTHFSTWHLRLNVCLLDVRGAVPWGIQGAVFQELKGLRKAKSINTRGDKCGVVWFTCTEPWPQILVKPLGKIRT